MRTLFGVDGFRPGQEAVIRSVLDGRDTLALMPTGAGKSLCYQLPGVFLRGTTVVVSPLISLMKDQTDKLSGRGRGMQARLRRKGIQGDALNQEVERCEQRRRSDETKLEQMVLYGQSLACRWKTLLDYFEENSGSGAVERCGTCHVCRGDTPASRAA